jgi:hypothetical protein
MIRTGTSFENKVTTTEKNFSLLPLYVNPNRIEK